MRTLYVCLIAFIWTSLAPAQESYLLKPDLAPGDSWSASVKLQLGGERIKKRAGDTVKEPISVLGKLQYEEQIVRWIADSSEPVSSVRYYDLAAAKVEVEQESQIRQLPESSRVVFTEILGQQSFLSSNKKPLTRNHFDLVNTMPNTLAIQRLLPGRALVEGESWEHHEHTMGPLLGLDYVAVCEVSSVVIGMENNHVQLRMAGTVHGTIDGAPTEMELRGAYLFHLDQKRISKFNLAIKEKRTASDVIPGMDVVAKATIVMSPVSAAPKITKTYLDQFEKNSGLLHGGFLYEANQKGYRFHHDRNWYVTYEHLELSTLSYQQDGEQIASCDISTLPARSEGRFTPLEEFEIDVRNSLGDKLQHIVASTEWQTPQGYECLGVVAQGLVEDVPMEWRYYLVSSPNLPRVSISLTVEQENLKQFNDADRLLIDSLELFPKQKPATARKKTSGFSR